MSRTTSLFGRRVTGARLWVLLGAALLVCATSLPAPVLAQPAGDQQAGDQQAGDQQAGDQQPSESSQQIASPDDEQLALNDEAVRAIIDGDHHRAIALLDESLVLGELNITFLNLGRAYQKLGRCHKAREAFEAVKTAPAVAKPAPSVILAKAEQYLEELGECPAKPEPESPDPSADPGEPMEPATDGGGQRADDSFRTWGTAATVGGGVLLASAAGSYLWAESLRDEVREASRTENGVVVGMSQSDAQSNEDNADLIATTGVGLAVVGTAAVGVGVYMLVSGAQVEEAPSVSVSVGDGGVGLVWRGHF